jgi:hypothetical protein
MSKLANQLENVEKTVDNMIVEKQRRNRKKNYRKRPNNKRKFTQVETIVRQPRNRVISKKTRIEKVVNQYDMEAYINAIINPFTAQALGARRPDVHTEPSLPATDRILFNLQPSFFQPLGPPPSEAIIGIFIMFAPRCNSAGWSQGLQNIQALGSYEDRVTLNIPLSFVDYNLTLLQHNVLNPPICNLSYSYNLILIGVTETGVPVRLAVDNIGQLYQGFGATFVSLQRYELLIANVLNNRILGAGMKLNPTSPPIDTGGNIYAGQMSQDTLYKKLLGALAGTTNFLSIADSMHDATQYTALEGCSARYNSLQGPVQHHYKDLNLDEIGLYFSGPPPSPYSKNNNNKINNNSNNSNTSDYKSVDDYVIEDQPFDMRSVKSDTLKMHNLSRQVAAFALDEKSDYSSNCNNNNTYVKSKVLPYTNKWLNKRTKQNPLKAVFDTIVISYPGGLDPSKQDMCDPGDYCPVIYWQFESTVKTYSLQCTSYVHDEAHPIETSPFVASKMEAVGGLEELAVLLSDETKYPVTATGHSFKSFISRVGKFAKKGLLMAPKLLASGSAKIAAINKILGF